jgi:arylsulfatase A-like enzyme
MRHRTRVRYRGAAILDSIYLNFFAQVDIVPTILEATGIPKPVMVDGIAQEPIEGVSLAYTFDKANADAPSLRPLQR